MPMILRNTDILFNSNAVLASPPGTAPMFAARAWVNFNGSNAAIRASGNVSSVNRLGVGNYSVNFATAMPDVNYCVTTARSKSDEGSSTENLSLAVLSTGNVTVRSAFANNAVGRFEDVAQNCVAVFR